MYRTVYRLILISLFIGCTHESLPPALPDPPVVIQDFLDGYLGPIQEQEAMLVERDAEGCNYARLRKAKGKRATKVLDAAPTLPGTFPEIEPTAAKKERRVDPEKLVSQANDAARVFPTGTGYYGGKAIYRYPYSSGKIYVVYTSIGTVTRLYFPAGEKLATVPLFNKDQWEYGSARIGPDATGMDVLAFRPLEEGARLLTAIDTDKRSYFLSFIPGKNAMLGVTWEVARTEKQGVEEVSMPEQEMSLPKETIRCQAAHSTMSMPVDLAQLHTEYQIHVKGHPNFQVLSVVDDSRKVLVKLKAFGGNAPVVFSSDADGKRGLVQFSPYRVPNDPSKAVYLVVESIWSKLELVGSDDASVVITRLSNTPAVAVKSEVRP